MGLQFADINERRNILFSVTDEELALYNDVIASFNEKFDNLFDLYSDFRLYNTHITFLISLTEGSREESLIRFCSFLETALSSQKDILVLGD